jgi:hypothetical protein
MPEGSFVSAERQDKRRKVMKSWRKKKVLMRQVVAEFGAARGSSGPSETSSHLKTRRRKVSVIISRSSRRLSTMRG